MSKIIKNAFVNAIGTIIYIIIVASFLFYLQGSFPKGLDVIFIPIAMLLLFVFSAALTGILVFGKPAMLFLDGKKKESLFLIGYTLGFLLLATVIAFILLLIYSSMIV